MRRQRANVQEEEVKLQPSDQKSNSSPRRGSQRSFGVDSQREAPRGVSSNPRR